MAADEARLIQEFLRGDGPSIRVVDDWIEVALRGYAHVLQAEREDLKQEVRTRVLRNLQGGRFDGRSALRTYVHRIAKNVCIDSIREKKRHPSVDGNRVRIADENGSQPGADAASIARDLVEKILAGFSEEDRLLVEMVFVEHYSYSEVASRLGVPEGTVKSRMFRCKNQILARRRALLGDKETAP